MKGLPTPVILRVLVYCDIEVLLVLGKSSSAGCRLERLLRQSVVWRHRAIAVRDLADLLVCRQNRGWLTNIPSLDCSRTELTRKNLAILPNLFRELKEVSFGGCIEVDDNIVGALVRLHGKSLVRLDLAGCQGLTNASLKHIAAHCKRLRSLILKNSLFSNAGFEMLQEVASLSVLSLSRCYLLGSGHLPSLLKPLRIRELDLSANYGIDCRLLADLLDLQPQLVLLNVCDVDDLTRSDIRRLQQMRPGLTIEHNAKIDDDNEASIRAYLMALVAYSVVPPAANSRAQ